jgi:predicted NBD/HSP70 family sugar kinase
MRDLIVKPDHLPAVSFRNLSANDRHILSLIHLGGPISRAELGRRTGLALPTVVRLTDQMIDEGLIATEQKVMMGRRGQPSLPLILAQDAAFAFGVSVSMDRLAVNLVDLSGRVLAEIEEAIDATNREEAVARIIVIANDLVEQTSVPRKRIYGIGIALSGFFVGAPHRLNAPLGMEDWAVEDLEHALRGRLGLPVLIENDGNAAAVGERIYGVGRSIASFAYIFVDSGLGGGLVLDGKLWRGRNGNAGEFTGLLPPEVRANRATLSLLLTMLNEDGHCFATIAEMLSAYDPAWPTLDRWLGAVKPQINMIISAIGAVFDPDAIVVGGRLPLDLADRLIAVSHFYTVDVRGQDRAFPALRRSEVSQNAAALGAAALTFDHLFF